VPTVSQSYTFALHDALPICKELSVRDQLEAQQLLQQSVVLGSEVEETLWITGCHRRLPARHSRQTGPRRPGRESNAVRLCHQIAVLLSTCMARRSTQAGATRILCPAPSV